MQAGRTWFIAAVIAAGIVFGPMIIAEMVLQRL